MQNRPRSPETPTVETVTGVRLPIEIRASLQRAAATNHRSLSQEIIQRLSATLAGDGLTAPVAGAALKPHDYGTGDGPKLNDAERRLLSLFTALSPEKQLALLTFLKS